MEESTTLTARSQSDSRGNRWLRLTRHPSGHVVYIRPEDIVSVSDTPDNWNGQTRTGPCTQIGSARGVPFIVQQPSESIMDAIGGVVEWTPESGWKERT